MNNYINPHKIFELLAYIFYGDFYNYNEYIESLSNIKILCL